MRKPNPLKGVTVNDLLDIEQDTLSSMTKPEMRRVVSRMADAANKRLRRLEGAGYRRGRYYGEDSIAGVKKFSTRGLDLNGLRKEYARARRFLSSDTSTLKGTRAKVRSVMKAANEMRATIKESKRSRDVQREEVSTSANDGEVFIWDIPLSGEGEYEYEEDATRTYSDEEAWELSLNLFVKLRDDELGDAFAGLGWDSDQQRAFAYSFIQEQYADVSAEEMITDAREVLSGIYEGRESSGRGTLGGIEI